MFETHLTVVGVAATAPTRLRSERTGVTGAKLRLLSTSRRYDKSQGQWVDGDRLFVEVVCWRDLADHVSESVFKGDPLVVTGRLYTRDYEVDGKRRWAYEIDATSVGHDLARGKSQFQRPERAWPADAVDLAAADETPPGGEATSPEAAGQEVADPATTGRRGELVAARAGDAAAVSTVDASHDPAAQRPITPPAAFAA